MDYGDSNDVMWFFDNVHLFVIVVFCIGLVF